MKIESFRALIFLSIFVLGRHRRLLQREFNLCSIKKNRHTKSRVPFSSAFLLKDKEKTYEFWHTSFPFLLTFLLNPINFDTAIDIIIKMDNKYCAIKKRSKFMSFAVPF
ncbi:hypothetical protein DOE78_09175 [Bacillus sp. Y1]|nr:hypothetical protein DOE78_09175 [Bacillus sp. Y1]